DVDGEQRRRRGAAAGGDGCDDRRRQQLFVQRGDGVGRRRAAGGGRQRGERRQRVGRDVFVEQRVGGGGRPRRSALRGRGPVGDGVADGVAAADVVHEQQRGHGRRRRGV